MYIKLPPLVVRKRLSAGESRALADRIENDIKERFPGTSVIIHVEPCQKTEEACKEYDGGGR